MKPLFPTFTLELLPEIQAQLLALLESLSPEEWTRPTVCTGWSVKDVAQHLLADVLGILSGQRDGQRGSVKIDGGDWQALVNFIDQQNDLWVQATRRLSPPVICDLLRHNGDQLNAFFAALDPFAPSVTVSWASSEPAPVWMEIGREYTEFWTHQQHIRDAVGKPGLKEPRYLAPLLALFVRALPRTYRHVTAEVNTLVRLVIPGEAGGVWDLLREQTGWTLYQAAAALPDAVIQLDPETAWRLFTKGISPEAAREQAVLEGDFALANSFFNSVSIIA